MDHTQKRQRLESESPNYQELAEKYKEKLILLARAYAKLLLIIESYAAVEQSSSKNKACKSSVQNNQNNSIEEDDDVVVEEKDDQLLCCSQLDDYKDSQEEESPSDFLIPSYTSEGINTKPELSIHDYDNDVARFGSVASQSNFFSTFIENCGTDLGPIPELDGLLNLDSMTAIPQQSQIQNLNGDDTSETDTILVTNQCLLCPCHVTVKVVVFVKDPKNSSNILTTVKNDAHGDEILVVPNGNLEMGESWEKCARREVNEEIGFPIHNIKHIHTANDIINSNKHCVNIFMSAECFNNESLVSLCRDRYSYSWQQINEIASSAQKELKLCSSLSNFLETKPNDASLQFPLNFVSPCK